MNRRTFLRRAGQAALLSTLANCLGANLACRLTRPGPTATPPFLPTPLNTPTATAIPTPSPTQTPTTPPSPTATEAPTPTEPPAPGTEEGTAEPGPTPANPFPPGPPTKLGLFVERYESAIVELVQLGQMPLVCTMEHDTSFARSLKAAAPHTQVVGRIILPQINLDADTIPLVQPFIDQLMPLAGDPQRMEAYTAWQAYNEPVADTADKMKRLADFEAERVRLLAERGVKSVIGNFAAGHPPLELWPYFRPALEAVKQHGGYLGLHEYSAPAMQFGYGSFQLEPGQDQGDEGWLTLRYRKAYRQQLIPMGLKVPLLITECGLDGTIKPRPGPEGKGWRDFAAYWQQELQLGADAPLTYVNQLAWYDGELQKDDYVLGAAIFVAGGSEEWKSYEILGQAAEVLKLYLQAHPAG
jgi:hypothetical protein